MKSYQLERNLHVLQVITFNYILQEFTIPYYPLILSGFNKIQTLSTKNI